MLYHVSDYVMTSRRIAKRIVRKNRFVEIRWTVRGESLSHDQDER